MAAVAGQVLREVRAARSLTLRQVTVRSAGRFKPSSIASYERGERQISLERLFALTEVYDVAPERLVAAIASRLEALRTPERAREDEDTLIVMDPWDPLSSGAAEQDAAEQEVSGRPPART